MSRSISVAFLGGAQKIGASCHVILLQSGRQKIAVMIDAGRDPRTSRDPEHYDKSLPDMQGLYELLRSGVTELVIVLTHEHFDHSGALILIVLGVEQEFPGLPIRILMTRETAAFAAMLWEEDARDMQGRGWADHTPRFTRAHIARIKSGINFIKPRREIQLAEGIKLLPADAGHTLGSVSPGIEAWGETIFHTGDISFTPNPHLSPALFLQMRRTTMLISEATNLNAKSRKSREEAKEEFFSGVENIVDHGGIALILSFRDRVQWFVEDLVRNGMPPEKILLDGVGIKVAEMTRGFLPSAHLHTVQGVQGQADREKLLKSGWSGVVIATGGMGQGAAVEWMKLLLPIRGHGVFLSGYACEDTPAGLLREAMADRFLESKAIQLPDGRKSRRKQWYPINATVIDERMSGHAETDQLEQFARGMNPQHLVFVHGDKRGVQRYISGADASSFAADGKTKIHFPPTRDRNGSLFILGV
ncbi:MAG: MBL fold metallo-hydrolase [Parcubacteria group bacterium]|nr:MBL fold metallo-hydrolase [Parcubacteria group bacterium]